MQALTWAIGFVLLAANPAHAAQADQSAAETRRLQAQSKAAACEHQSQAETRRLLAHEARAKAAAQ